MIGRGPAPLCPLCGSKEYVAFLRYGFAMNQGTGEGEIRAECSGWADAPIFRCVRCKHDWGRLADKLPWVFHRD